MISLLGKQSIGATTAATISTSIATAADTHLLVVMMAVGGATLRSGGAPTYNGVALTQAGTTQQHSSGPEVSVELWYMINPAVGTYTLAIPNAGELSVASIISSYTSANGTIEFVDADGATGSGGDEIGPTLDGGMFSVAIFGTGYQYISGLTESDTLLYEVDAGDWGYSGQYGTSNPLSWTYGYNDDWAIAAASFGAASLEISKTVAYAVVTPPVGAHVSKVVAYAVLGPAVEPDLRRQPVVFVCT